MSTICENSSYSASPFADSDQIGARVDRQIVHRNPAARDQRGRAKDQGQLRKQDRRAHVLFAGTVIASAPFTGQRRILPRSHLEPLDAGLEVAVLNPHLPPYPERYKQQVVSDRFYPQLAV